MASLWFRCYLDDKGYCYRRKGGYTECVSCDKSKNCEKKKSPSGDGVCASCVKSERMKKQSKLPEGV
jgi:hypothetical protein